MFPVVVLLGLPLVLAVVALAGGRNRRFRYDSARAARDPRPGPARDVRPGHHLWTL